MLRTIGSRAAVFERQRGIDDNTLLLLRGSGAPGATTFIDVSKYARTITPVGNAQVAVAGGKFNRYPYARFDGTGDYVGVPNSADWIWASDFCIDAWVRLNAVPGLSNVDTIFVRFNSNPLYFDFSIDNNMRLYSVLSNGGTIWNFGANNSFPSIGIFHHCCIERFSGVVTIYVNGLPTASVNSTATVPDTATGVEIGGWSGNASYMNGDIEELRVSNVARFKGPFVPPRRPYTR